jgi:hypothetical protein
MSVLFFVCYLLAAICFLVAALSVSLGRINLVALGLFFFTVPTLINAGSLLG